MPGKWRSSVLVGGDGAGGFRLCAMGEKPDDYGALFLAEPAGGACGRRVGALGRANDHFVACGRGQREGRVGGQYDDDGPAIGCFKLVGFDEIIGAEIDRESALVGGAHCGSIARSLVPVANNGLVRIRPAPFPLVRARQLGEHIDINRIVFAGEITRLIVAPQLTKGECRNARDERRPIITAPLFRDFAPVKRERTARACIAPLRF